MRNKELVNAILKEAIKGSGRPKRRKAGSKTTMSRRKKSSSKSRKPVRKSAKKGKAKSPYIAFVKSYHRQHPNLTWAQAMRKASPHYRKMHGGDFRSTVKKAANYGSKINKGLRDTKFISRVLRGYSTLPLPGSTVSNDLSLLASTLGYGR